LKYEDGSNVVINYFSNGSKSYSKEKIEVYNQERTIIIDNFRKTEAFAAAGAILYIIALYAYQILKNRNLVAVNKKTTLLLSIVGIFMIPLMSPGIASTLFRDNSEFYKSWLIEPSETVKRLLATNGLIIVGFFFFALILFFSIRRSII
jgi:tellurite resistance protein TehA-like permease